MVSNIITKTNGKDKVIDFRDGLVPARVEDYAMLHGVGGKDHAPNSVIKLFICDYSAGKGEKSKTVSANLTPVVCEQLFEVCKRNIGTQVMDGGFAHFEEQRAMGHGIRVLSELGGGVLNNVIKLFGRISTAAERGEFPASSAIASGLNTMLTKTREKCGSVPAPEKPAYLSMPLHTDYSYTQDRVHNYASQTGGGDIAPVQRLQIWHAAYRKDGSLGNYPWTVKVTNGKAKVIVQPTGATTFNASTMTDVEEAYIQISDADMFRMMSNISHFVRVWENVVATEIVQQGEAQREAERKAFAAEGQST